MALIVKTANIAWNIGLMLLQILILKILSHFHFMIVAVKKTYFKINLKDLMQWTIVSIVGSTIKITKTI